MEGIDMTNLDRAAAFAAANAGTTTIYFGTTPEDIRNRLAALLPPDATFDGKALTAVFLNGSKILFFPATMRPEQSMALYCDNMYKDEQMADGPYNLDGVVQRFAEDRFPQVT